jgi:hypothetical protein
MTIRTFQPGDESDVNEIQPAAEPDRAALEVAPQAGYPKPGLFDTLADPRRSIRRSLSCLQTVRDQVRRLLSRRSRKRPPSTGP